ncbi:hypothetical protein BC829DRAFT_299110 [Chytridium lagenaria]|nr:hypothetical protein BC829DRAFT_299110 [Chytridium lagenaria]
MSQSSKPPPWTLPPPPSPPSPLPRSQNPPLQLQISPPHLPPSPQPPPSHQPWLPSPFVSPSAPTPKPSTQQTLNAHFTHLPNLPDLRRHRHPLPPSNNRHRPILHLCKHNHTPRRNRLQTSRTHRSRRLPIPSHRSIRRHPLPIQSNKNLPLLCRLQRPIRIHHLCPSPTHRIPHETTLPHFPTLYRLCPPRHPHPNSSNTHENRPPRFSSPTKPRAPSRRRPPRS